MVFTSSTWKKTLEQLDVAYAAMKEIAEKGGKVLFVGTKKTGTELLLLKKHFVQEVSL